MKANMQNLSYCVLMLQPHKLVGEPQNKTGDKGNSGCASRFPAPRRGILAALHPTLTTQAGDASSLGRTQALLHCAGTPLGCTGLSHSVHPHATLLEIGSPESVAGMIHPFSGLSHPIYTNTIVSQGEVNTGRAVICCK